MERLSALMDGELDRHAIDSELGKIKSDPQREAAWETYHLIGDALRGEIVFAQGIGKRVRLKLADEPTVLAPRMRAVNRIVRRAALPIAASVSGIAVVAWLVLSNYSAISPVNNGKTADMLAAVPQEMQLSDGSEVDAMSEYLMAHQQYSPSTAIQGVASYVRTVSTADATR